MTRHTTSRSYALPGLAAVLLLGIGCSSRVDLAEERQTVSPDGGVAANGSGGNSNEASQATGGGAAGEASSGGTGGAEGVAGSVGTGGSVGGSPFACPAAPACSNVEMRAGGWSAGTPFSVAPGEEAIECFWFHDAGAAAMQAIAFTPLVDDTVMVHDWSLYSVSTPQVTGYSTACGTCGDGLCAAGETPESCPTDCASGNSGSNLLFTWEPGVGQTVLPASSPASLGSGDFVLQVRYLNRTDHVLTDRTGVSICACTD